MAKTKDDCRAIDEDFLKEFIDGKFSGFTELVKKHPELCLCFRGNSNAVEIYINNFLVFKINKNIKSEMVTIGFKLARYSKEWNKYAESLFTNYCFRPKKHPETNKIDDTFFNYLHCYNDEINILTKENIEVIYVSILKPIIKDFFSLGKKKDYFKDYKGIEHFKNNPYCEKTRQQQLFFTFKNTQDGYFIYDLEFNQQYRTKEEREAEKEKDSYSNNKPDALAIKFKNGKPTRLAFIEIKSKAKALDGASGIENHINGMINYNQDKYKTRCKEAYKILDQYRKIGLYNLENNDIKEKDFNENDLKKEILLIFTDDAIIEWGKDPYNHLREKAKKIPIKLQDCIICRYEE